MQVNERKNESHSLIYAPSIKVAGRGEIGLLDRIYTGDNVLVLFKDGCPDKLGKRDSWRGSSNIFCLRGPPMLEFV